MLGRCRESRATQRLIMIAEPINPVPNVSKTKPVVVAMPRNAGSMNVVYMVVNAGLNICSSNSANAVPVSTMRIVEATGAMYAGSSLPAKEVQVSEEIELIRTIGGLTRDQLAQLLGVSRRTIHTWSNGGAIRAEHYDRVMDLAERARKMKAQPSFKVRQLLLKGTNISLGRSVSASKAVLVSDEQPFTHNLNVRPSKLKIFRK